MNENDDKNKHKGEDEIAELAIETPQLPPNTEHDIYRIAELWSSLENSEKEEYLERLPRDQLSALFLELDTFDQKQLLKIVPLSTRKKWIRILEPDDLADLLREISEEEKEETLSF